MDSLETETGNETETGFSLANEARSPGRIVVDGQRRDGILSIVSCDNSIV